MDRGTAPRRIAFGVEIPRLPQDQKAMRLSVHLLPCLIPEGSLAGGIAVVVDVLRATTSMIHALEAGCEAIVPCAEIDEARRAFEGFPSGAALLAGERQGVPIEGFDLANSPDTFNQETCGGRTLVMTSTNGTRAILASLGADRVLIAAFANLGATRSAIRADGRPVHVVCSGTDGLISLEDSMLGGALAEGANLQNDEARIAARAWRDARSAGHDGSLASVLASGRGGHRVRSLGLGADLEAASRVDSIPIVAEVRRDPLRIVRNG